MWMKDTVSSIWMNRDAIALKIRFGWNHASKEVISLFNIRVKEQALKNKFKENVNDSRLLKAWRTKMEAFS